MQTEIGLTFHLLRFSYLTVMPLLPSVAGNRYSLSTPQYPILRTVLKAKLCKVSR